MFRKFVIFVHRIRALLLVAAALVLMGAVGPLPDEATYLLFVEVVINLAKLAARVLGINVPDGTWAYVLMGLGALYGILGPLAGLLPFDFDLTPYLPAAPFIIDGLNALLGFFTVVAGAIGVFNISKALNLPLLGYSQSRN